MSLKDILFGAPRNFDNEITPVFNDICSKTEEAVTDIKFSNIESIKKVNDVLLTSSFQFLKLIFGEKGIQNKYLKKIDRVKAYKLLGLFYVFFYVALKESAYYKVKFRTNVAADDICLVYERLFNDNMEAVKILIEEFLKRDTTGRMLKLAREMYSIVLSTKADDMSNFALGNITFSNSPSFSQLIKVYVPVLKSAIEMLQSKN